MDYLVITDAEQIDAVVAGYRADPQSLAGGLDLYYALERTTSLLEFHTMLRLGARNRTVDGMQQSYGDHNRLLMWALDRLLAGDVAWLRAHVTAGETIDEESLRSCAATAAALELGCDERLALWLGAALHDCGMLRSPDAHIDVEDGLVIARALLDRYCPTVTRAVATFALRHHDYIKDACLGEAPVGFIAADLERVDEALRPLALAALGLIQVAGAASLGQGRLSNFRLDIFHACVAGTALDDGSRELRLARLLAPAPDAGSAGNTTPSVADARVARECLDADARSELDDLLDNVFVHGWHPFVRSAPPAERVRTLATLARHNREWGADHLVIDDSLRNPGDGRLPPRPATVRHDSLSGRVVVTVGG